MRVSGWLCESERGHGSERERGMRVSKGDSEDALKVMTTAMHETLAQQIVSNLLRLGRVNTSDELENDAQALLKASPAAASTPRVHSEAGGGIFPGRQLTTWFG